MRFLALALLVGTTFGCDRLLGIEDLARPASVDAGTDATTEVGVDNACTQCSASQCGSASALCKADPRCQALVECVSVCKLDDVLCRAQCERDNSAAAALPEYLAVDGCRRDKCLPTCYGSKGLITALLPSCACAESSCAEQVLACIRSGLARPDDAGATDGGTSEPIGGCERRVACMAGRINPDVFVECAQPQQGVREFRALRSCLQRATCKTGEDACPFAYGDLACLNSFKYGTTSRPDTEVTLRASAVFLTDPGRYDSLVGARVTPCFGECDANCKQNDATTVITKSAGDAHIRLRMAFGQFTGCFRVDAPAELKLPEMRVYPGRVIHLDEDEMWTIIPERLLIDYYGARFASADWAAHSHALGTLHDCSWMRTLDAQIEVTPKGGDGENVVIYLQGGVPDDAAKGTTSSGNFAIMNMPAGPHTVTAKKDGATIATVNVVSIPGTLMDVNMYPQAVK